MRLLLAGVLVAAPLASAAAQYHPSDWVVPTQYRSADLEHHVTVVPALREGVGPATYHAARDDRPVWTKELPFTLRHAHVEDDGTIAGWGWAARWWEDQAGPDAFVALIAPDGAVRMHRTVSVGFGRARRSHAPTIAEISGVTYDRERDRLVARLLSGRNSDFIERWLAFDVAGEASEPTLLQPFANVASSALLDSASSEARSLGSGAITGTPLTLAAWMLLPIDTREAEVKPTLVLAVLDTEARPVWTLVKNASGAEGVRWHPLSDLKTEWSFGTSIAATGFNPRRFAAIDPETRERGVLFEVEPSLDASAKWTVRRHVPAAGAPPSLGASPRFINWSEFVPSRPPSPDWEAEESSLRSLPEVELRSLGALTIPRASRVTLDANDRIHALCDEIQDLRVFERDGAEMWRAALPSDVWQAGYDCLSLSAHSDGTVWIGYRADNGGSRFARFEAPGRRLDDVTFEADPPFVRIIAGADGTRWRLEQRGLFATDDNPSKLRSIEIGPHGMWIWEPGAAMFAHDGRLLVVVPPNDVSQRDHRWAGLCRYGRSGEPVRDMLEIPAWVTQRTGVAFDGDFVVLAHEGSSLPTFPALVLLGDKSGRAVRLVKNGATPPGTPFFAASGKELWLHDGASIERFASPVAR